VALGSADESPLSESLKVMDAEAALGARCEIVPDFLYYRCPQSPFSSWKEIPVQIHKEFPSLQPPLCGLLAPSGSSGGKSIGRATVLRVERDSTLIFAAAALRLSVAWR
jgi:hypothetical protein